MRYGGAACTSDTLDEMQDLCESVVNSAAQCVVFQGGLRSGMLRPGGSTCTARCGGQAMAGAGQRSLRGPGDGLEGWDSSAGQGSPFADDPLEVQLQGRCWWRPQGPQPGQHQFVNGCSICISHKTDPYAVLCFSESCTHAVHQMHCLA